MLRKTIAVSLCLALTGLCAGVEPWEAAAAEVGRVKVDGAGAGSGIPVVPGSVQGARLEPSGPLQSLPVLESALEAAPAVPQLSAPGAQALPVPALPAAAVPAPAPAAVEIPQAPAPAALAPGAPAGAGQAAPAAEPAAGEARTPFEKSLDRLQAPSLIEASPSQAGGEGAADAAGRDFSRRIGEAAPAAAAPAAVEAPASSAQALPSLAKASRGQEARRDKTLSLPSASPTANQSRSPVFPAVAAGLSALAWQGVHALAGLAGGAVVGSAGLAPAATVLAAAAGAVGFTALAATTVFAVAALADVGAFAYGLWRGRRVTDAQFWDFVRDEVMAGRMDAGVAEMLRVSRPGKASLALGFTAGGAIHLRPELAATPWLFRRVLSHQLQYLRSNPQRGPPANRVQGVWRHVLTELSARAGEFRAGRLIKGTRIPVLERALRLSQLSLALARPYEVLVVNAGSSELKNPAVYQALSGGKAHLQVLDGADPVAALADPANRHRFQAVVLDKSDAILPEEASLDAKRLGQALGQLDSLFVLATRLTPQDGAFPGTPAAAKRYESLASMARQLDRRDKKSREKFEKLVREFWTDLSSSRLKGMPATDLIASLYQAMPDKGVAFMPFAPTDDGLPVWEKLLRFWEAPDGGQFRLVRVDLETGGHILILRKVEARVGLWLRPQKGFLAVSVPDANASAQAREEARTALSAAGFADQLDRFDELGVELRHVFGADVGRQEIYVTVPRRNASAIRRFVSGSAMEVGPSQADFEPLLMESAELHQVKPVWQAGITGADGTIMWIDTGADKTHEDFQGRLDVVDMVNEGPEDWIGHGTHVAGISISGGTPYTGMAKAARGIMAKVFSRETPGASDGEIMGSAAIGMQKGVDVINLSLGSKGSSSDNLATFFSQLTHEKNANGEYPFVVASAGNSGPFDQTLSQPAAGVDVFATAAAAVGADDRLPEIAFYSSVGPDLDKRYAVRRLRLKPDATAKGGDVTTEPGSANVYSRGVFSAKSRNMPKNPSDTPDGKHTGMSGTSMSSPMMAGIALLLKLAFRLTGAETPFTRENMPLVIKAVLMRTAQDMHVPVWFQGAGFVDAWAAVRLVAESVGYVFKSQAARLWARLQGAPAQAGAGDAWRWVESYKRVLDLEDKVYAAAELAKTEAKARFDDGASGSAEDGETAVDRAQASGDAVAAEVAAKFKEARAAVFSEVLAALKDPVWLVRRQAALALLNFKSPDAAMPLMEAALNDADGRVRQMALLALAELPTHSVDVLLQKAAADPRWEVAAYAAYALARHGDRSEAARIATGLAYDDKKIRFSAAWLLGQLGDKAAAVDAETLSAAVRSPAERGNVRHVAAAALANLAVDQPAAVSDQVIKDLLSVCGPDNLALTRTVAKFFPAALRSPALVARMRVEPLLPVVTDFVLRNRAAVGRPGALGDLVSLLARVVKVPLELPTPVPDPAGVGVAGVDPALGSLDVLVGLPEGRELSAYQDARQDFGATLAAAGLDAGTLAKYGAEFKAGLPLSRALWLSVPAYKFFAMSLELRQRGYSLNVSQPEYSLSRRSRDAAFAGLSLDLGADIPVVPADADLSLVRVTAARAVSEAKVMAALEALRSRVQDPRRNPLVVSVSLGSPALGPSPLAGLIDRLALDDVGVVLPAGNEGPAEDSVSALARGGLALVVAAAGKTEGLESYSARGSAEAPVISWADLVDDLATALPSLTEAAGSAARAILGEDPSGLHPSGVEVGTGAAAERTAAKLAAMARRMAGAFAGQDTPLPAGYFFYLADLVKRTLSGLPGRGARETGAGVFDHPEKAMELLETRLLDPQAVRSEAAALGGAAGRRSRLSLAPSTPARAAQRAAFAAAQAVAGQVMAQPRLIAAAAELSRRMEGAGFQAQAVTPADGVEFVKELRAVLGAGTGTAAQPIAPFVFRKASGEKVSARAAGLEGFLFAKLELGPQGLDLSQAGDYFQYLDDLLAGVGWARSLRQDLQKLRRSGAEPAQLSRQLDERLVAAVKELQTELRAADASNWFRGAGVYMILARAYNRLKPGKNFFDSLDDAELQRIKDATKADAVWLLDIFEIGEARRWGTGGGSPYAIKGYRIKESLGGDAAFGRFVRRAHALGLKVGADEIPNHDSLDSDLLQTYPEAFVHLVPPQELSKAEIMAQAPPSYYYMETDRYPEDGKRVHKKILVRHPRAGFGEGVAKDLAQRDYSQAAARDWEVAQARRLTAELGVDVLRRDMSSWLTNASYYDSLLADLGREHAQYQGWVRGSLDRFTAGFRARREALKGKEILEDATYAPKTAKPSAAVFDAAYGYETDLSRSGSNGVYNKNDHDPALGQVGLYDALVSRDAARIRAALRNVAFRSWQRGGSALVNFIGTQDGGEGNPVDKFGKFLKAAALTSLLARPVLMYNGVEQGVGRGRNLKGPLSESSDKEKAIPFDIPVSIDWSESHWNNAEFLKLVFAKSAEVKELFEQGAMDVLEPTAPSSVVAYTVSAASRRGRKTVLAAANFGDAKASGLFRFPAALAAFGAFAPAADKTYVLRDLANKGPDGKPAVYQRSGKELAEKGLFIELKSGEVHLFEVEEAPAAP